MPPTRKELALRYLRRKLERGELPAGSRLSDLALSKEMGISRTPVREAIQTLVAEGVATSSPHAGVFVRALDEEDVRELYELREALESFAAARAAERREELPDLLERLRKEYATLETLAQAVEQSGRSVLTDTESQTQRETDLAFHRILITAPGNRRIERTVEQSALHTRLFATMSPVMTLAILRRILTFHGGVLKAIETGDAETARRTMAAHIRAGLAFRLDHWNERPSANAGEDIPPALRDLV